jgi:hypothetical protein
MMLAAMLGVMLIAAIVRLWAIAGKAIHMIRTAREKAADRAGTLDGIQRPTTEPPVR